MNRFFQFIGWSMGIRKMPATFKQRHAMLGTVVLRLFPMVMQHILKECITPRALKVKYQLKDIRINLTVRETSLMEKLPNMEKFTIELCYKILRFENVMLDPSCSWGNIPDTQHVEIADDIQRIVNATNKVIYTKSEDISETYYDEFLTKLQDTLGRVDKYLHQDLFLQLLERICWSDINSTEILEELSTMPQINVTNIVDKDSEKKEYFSRISLVIIENFSNILRDIIRSIIAPGKLYHMCLSHSNTFTLAQKSDLQKLRCSNSFDSLDVSLIYKLLRQFSLIKPPSNGWGNNPGKTDTELADDIERIRLYRNTIAHSCSTNIEKKRFEEYFNHFRKIGFRMDTYFRFSTNYENKIVSHKTCRLDMQLQTKYENAMRNLENIKLRFEKKPIQFFWGDSFNNNLTHLRSVLKHEKSKGRRKINVQIIFQNEADIEGTSDILNSLKDEINEGLNGIEFIVATQGSIVLHVYILLKMLETDQILQSTLTSFLEKILEYIRTSSTDTIDVVLLPVKGYTPLNTPHTIAELTYLEFDIKAELFETDDKMEEQLRKISDVISRGSGPNQNSTATLLPFDFGYTPLKTPHTSAELPYLEFDKEAELFETDDEMEEQLRKYSDVISRGRGPNQKSNATLLSFDFENMTTAEGALVQAKPPDKCSSNVSVGLHRKLKTKQTTVIVH